MRRALLALVLVAITRAEETCLTSEEEPYLLFGTNTAYVFSNKPVPNSRPHDVPGCQPIAFWLLERHGSHNPEADEIAELQRLADLKNNVVANYAAGNFRNTNHRICSSDLNLLERWEWNTRQNLTFAGDLTSDGYITTQQLAQAWKKRYPGLLTDNRHDYMFKLANDRRSSTTFRAFTEGLFRAQAEGFDIPKEVDDKLIKPYESCPAWKREVEENNETVSQRSIFESKQEYREMITNISLRLGFSYDVDKATVLRMYQMCRYNKAWDVARISPWCSVFTREDLRRLEYAEDLDTYYKYGYGSKINQNLGCTFIKDMMDFFKTHVEHETPQQPRAAVRFGDYGSVLLALAALGAHKDVAPLTGDNYHTNLVQARRWAASHMAPFNANLAAALYKCETNGNFQVKDRFQVLFLENEREMYLEGCRVGLCDWSHVKHLFGEIADKCDLQFCNSATKISSFFALGLTFFVFFVRHIQL